ncbi:MAG TPA: inositol monophosphatase family protein [Anaerolineaceae bacterium]
MKPSLEQVEAWAKEAGAILREGYGKTHQVQLKGAVDLVTEIDHRSEALLIDRIQSAFPHHTIIAEESGLRSGQKEHCWYIDPLDGTLNYAHGLPLFAVSIAYAEYDQVMLAVVYEPMRDECYSAERGKGAWLNGEPIHVSQQTTLISSLFVTGFPSVDWTTDQNNVRYFERVSRLSQGVRRLGSAALDLCYVAAGRLDGFWENRLMPYDMAAGMLIVAEAGGTVTTILGEPNYLTPPYSVLAANAAIHPQLLQVLQDVRATKPT